MLARTASFIRDLWGARVVSKSPATKKPVEKLRTAAFEKALGHKFKNRTLLRRALTHASVRSQRDG